MDNNSKNQEEIAETAKKENQTANKLLQFFAAWADEATSFDIDSIIKSYRLMHKAFLESVYADDSTCRCEGLYVFNNINDLLIEIKESKSCTSLLPHKITQLLKIEKIVSNG